MFFLFQFLSLLPKKKHTKSNALKRQTRTHHSRHSPTHPSTRLSLCNTRSFRWNVNAHSSLSVREKKKKVKKQQTKEKNNPLGTHHRRDQFFSLPREESKRKFIKRHFDTHSSHARWVVDECTRGDRRKSLPGFESRSGFLVVTFAVNVQRERARTQWWAHTRESVPGATLSSLSSQACAHRALSREVFSLLIFALSFCALWWAVFKFLNSYETFWYIS